MINMPPKAFIGSIAGVRAIKPVPFVIDKNYKMAPITPLPRVPFPERRDSGKSHNLKIGDDDFRECMDLSHFSSVPNETSALLFDEDGKEGRDILDKYLDSAISALYLVMKCKEIQLLTINSTKDQFKELKTGIVTHSSRPEDITKFLSANIKLMENLEKTTYEYHTIATAFFMVRLRKSLMKIAYSSLHDSMIEDITAILKVKFDNIDITHVKKFKKELQQSVSTVSDGVSTEKDFVRLCTSKDLSPRDQLNLNIMAHMSAFTGRLYIERSTSPYRLAGYSFQTFMEVSLHLLGKDINSIGNSANYKEPLYEDELIYDIVGYLEFYIRKIQQLGCICDNCAKMIPNEMLVFCEYCGVTAYCPPKRGEDDSLRSKGSTRVMVDSCKNQHASSHENMCLIIRKVWKLALDNDVRRNGCAIS